MEEKIYDPVWKRWKTVPSTEIPVDVATGYEQQLELQLNIPDEATPEEVEQWQ